MAEAMAGKRRFSILGDSISTFEGCNPTGFRVFYEGERCAATGVREARDTWWAQVVDALGGELLANGSFSGSMVEGAGFPAGDSAERVAALARDAEHARALAATLSDAPTVARAIPTHGPACGARIESTEAI